MVLLRDRVLGRSWVGFEVLPVRVRGLWSRVAERRVGGFRPESRVTERRVGVGTDGRLEHPEGVCVSAGVCIRVRVCA